MGAISLPKSWVAEILTASDLNASFVEVRDKFNTYAVLTDTAKTVTVTHTWERTQTFTPSSGVGINVTTGGISVTGTSALAAVTCTTVTASGAISGTTGTFSSSVAATAVAVSGDLTAGVNGKIYSAATSTYLGLGNAGTEAIRVTGSAVYPVTDGGRALGVTGTNRWSHVYAKTSVTTEAGGKHIATDGTATLWAWCSSGQARIETAGGHAMSFGTNGSSRWLVTSGGFLLAQTDNTYDIGAAGAQRPRNVYIAGTIDVGGTSTLAAVTCTTLAPSGITTLSGTGATYALDFTGAAGRLRLANNGSLTFVQNDGSTAILTITESTGGVAFSGTVVTKASTTSSSGLQLPHGAAPSSPTNGDVWTTTAGMFAMINGTTVGPFLDSATGGITGSGTSGKLVKFTGTGSVGNSIITESGTTVTVANTLAATTVQTGSTSISNSGLFVGGNRVVGGQSTGWTAATGTPTRSTFATGSVTTAQLAERVKALIDDLLTHGLLTS